MKITIKTLLSLILSVQAASFSQFEDIPENHWGYQYMKTANEKGWMTGYSPTSFMPDKTVTRAQLVTLLYRFSGSPVGTSSPNYLDTANDAWYIKGLAWASSNGIVQGYVKPEGSYFRPDQGVSRQEVWTILERYAGDGSYGFDLSRFNDEKSIPEYARKGAAWSVTKGILSGKQRSDGLYADPAGSCTRAEACKILCVLDESDTSIPSINQTSLSVSGTKLVDASGNSVQLQGISSHGLAWYGDLINYQTLSSLKNLMNINTIRLAMYTDEYGGYCNGGDQSALKSKILDSVMLAEDLNMYVIVDWHVLSDANPLKYQNGAISFFDEISEKLKDKNNVLYEICNEPNGSATWSDIKAYAQKVIPVIRSNDPDSIIIVGTPQWSQRVDQAAADPLPFKNLLYSLHFYAGTHHDDLFNTAKSALAKGLPIIISEFGLSEASGSGNLDKTWGEKWIQWAKANSIGVIAWSLSNKQESSALLSPAYSSGSVDFNDLSQSGKMLRNIYTSSSEVNPEKPSDIPSSDTKDPADQDDSLFSIKPDQSLSVQLISQEEWNENGVKNVLVRLKVKNTGSTPVQISFLLDNMTDLKIKDYWNCNVQKKNNFWNISGPSWKEKLEPNEELEDLGLIIQFGNLISS